MCVCQAAKLYQIQILVIIITAQHTDHYWYQQRCDECAQRGEHFARDRFSGVLQKSHIMGLLLRLAVSAAVLLGILHAAEYTESWPVDAEIRGWNEWINGLIVPKWFAARCGLTHELTMYLRNLIFGTFQYQFGSGIWALYIYVIRGKHFFPDASKVRCSLLAVCGCL